MFRVCLYCFVGRTHPPGSPLWIQAHEASKMFLQQISNEPLRDDFTPMAATTSMSGSIGDESGTHQKKESFSRQSSGASGSGKRFFFDNNIQPQVQRLDLF